MRPRKEAMTAPVSPLEVLKTRLGDRPVAEQTRALAVLRELLRWQQGSLQIRPPVELRNRLPFTEVEIEAALSLLNEIDGIRIAQEIAGSLRRWLQENFQEALEEARRRAAAVANDNKPDS
jgi:hypothetical protein